MNHADQIKVGRLDKIQSTRANSGERSLRAGPYLSDPATGIFRVGESALVLELKTLHEPRASVRFSFVKLVTNTGAVGWTLSEKLEPVV